MKKLKGNSFFVRLLYIFGSLITVVSGVLILISFFFSRKFVTNQAQENITKKIEIIDDHFNRNYTKEISINLRNLSNSPLIVDYLSASEIEQNIIAKKIEQLFLQTTFDYTNYESIYFIDNQGQPKFGVKNGKRIRHFLEVYNNNSISQNRSQTSDSPQIAKNRIINKLSKNLPGEIAVSGPHQEELDNSNFYTGISILDMDTGNIGGYIIIKCSLIKFWKYLDKMQLFGENSIWVYSPFQDVLKQPPDTAFAFSPIEYLFKEADISEVQNIVYSKKSEIVNEGLFGQIRGSIIPDQILLKIAITVPYSLQFRDINPLIKFYSGVFFISIIVGLVLAWSISTYMSEPLEELASAAERVSGGDLGTQVELDTTGELKLLVDSFNDMAKNLKDQRTELENSELELKKLVEFPTQNPDPVLHIDYNGKILMINPALSGYFERNVLGASAVKIFPNFNEIFKEDSYENKPIQVEEKIGNKIFLFTIKRHTPTNSYYIYGADITELKKVQQDLITAKGEAEASDHAKSVFLATISHEVRTPLNVVLGYTDLLYKDLAEQMSTEQKGMFESIFQASDRLKQLIEDVLDVSRIEAGKMKFSISEIEADEMTRKCVNEIRVSAKEKNLDIIEEYGAPKIRISVDEVRLNQALGNILINAVKYTKKGCITIKSVVSGEKYLVSVMDTGIGIPEEFMPHIFTYFKQADEGYSRHYEGAGLGLHISNRLIRAMGGEIQVKSKENTGSTFTISLDISTTLEHTKKHKSEHSVDIPKIHGIRESTTILILDDNQPNVQYVEFVLKRLKINSMSIDTGEKAMKILQKNKVDCILADISLSVGMSGIDFMKEVRKLDKFDKIPIIAVTAHTMKGQKEEFLEMGFDGYLPKPFKEDDLVGILNKHLS